MKKKLTALLITFLFVIGSIMPLYVGSIDESPYPVYPPMQHNIEFQPMTATGGPVGGTLPPPGGYP
ncbi:MAG: hypothetical protein FWC73_11400 [Defluviitaleaceae bacterium]|nr:hypothetical protein [Defluviitaleaceae bacterium]